MAIGTDRFAAQTPGMNVLRRFAAETGSRPKRLSNDAGAALRAYHWPGNVRELRNLMERLTILVQGEIIEREDIDLGPRSQSSTQIRADLPLREAREEFEREYILARLRSFSGNVSRTAEALGVERSNLYRKLHAYGIQVERP